MCDGDATKTATMYVPSLKVRCYLMVDVIKFTSHGALFHFNNNNFKNDIQKNYTTFR